MREGGEQNWDGGEKVGKGSTRKQCMHEMRWDGTEKCVNDCYSVRQSESAREREMKRVTDWGEIAGGGRRRGRDEDGGGCGYAMRLSVSDRRFNAPERRFSATLSAALITTSIMMDGGESRKAKFLHKIMVPS